MSTSTDELLPMALVRKWSSRRRGRGRPFPDRSAAYQANYDRLTQYGNRCDWLKDDKFLRDLEGDSVDTEILDEELRSLQEDEPQTCRGKSVKFLESNPLQIVLCVLVLIDAGVVVAEILLDLHAIRGQYREANDQLHQVLDFIKDAHAEDLHGYSGNNVGHILELLHGLDYNASAPDSYSNGYGSDIEGYDGGGSGSGASSEFDDGGSSHYVGAGSSHSSRDRRNVFTLSDMLSLHLSPRLHEALLQNGVPDSTTHSNPRQQRLFSQQLRQSSNLYNTPGTGVVTPPDGAASGIRSLNHVNNGNAHASSSTSTSSTSSYFPSTALPPSGASFYLQTAMRLLRENIHLKAEIAKLVSGIRSGTLLDGTLLGGSSSSDINTDTNTDNDDNVDVNKNNNNNGEENTFDKEDLMIYRDLGPSASTEAVAARQRSRRDTANTEIGNRHVVHRHNHNKENNQTRGAGGHHANSKNEDHFNSYASGGGESRESDILYTGGSLRESGQSPQAPALPDGGAGSQRPNSNTHHPNSNNYDGHGRTKTVKTHTHSRNKGSRRKPRVNVTYYDDFDDDAAHAHTQAEKLKEIAHILHYCSIAILGIFVAQLFLKLFGMGPTEFFKKKMEIFDAVIILASFALDLVFLEGIGGAQGEEAAALLIVFLLWRILRVINGIMVTAKKRQEFRIKLQKRARRRGDKKVELLEEDRSLKEKEIAALRELCARRGADEDEIKACKPRRKSKSIMPRMDTSMGLTSVASLSLSLSMSMSGGAFNNIARSNPILSNRRDSMQDLLPHQQQQQQRNPRRSSLMSSKPIETLQNHFRGGGGGHGDKSPRSAGSLFSKRLSMEKVVEEKEAENGGEELINKRNTVCDAIQEGAGEANLALLDYNDGHVGDPTLTPPITGRKTPTVTFDMENELADDTKTIPPPPLTNDRASLRGGTPSPSRSENSLSNNSSMANGPVRRASTSSRHSNKDLDNVDNIVTSAGDVNSHQQGDVLVVHQGDVTTQHNNNSSCVPQPQQHQSTSPQHKDVAVVCVASSSSQTQTQQQQLTDVDNTSTSSPLRVATTTTMATGENNTRNKHSVVDSSSSTMHHHDVVSHLNEVTMHLDDVNTRLDDVATHLTDVIPIQPDDEELSTSSDSEGTETTRL